MRVACHSGRINSSESFGTTAATAAGTDSPFEKLATIGMQEIMTSPSAVTDRRSAASLTASLSGEKPAREPGPGDSEGDHGEKRGIDRPAEYLADVGMDAAHPTHTCFCHYC